MSDGAVNSESLITGQERIVAHDLRHSRHSAHQLSRKDSGKSFAEPDEMLYGEQGYWQHWWNLVLQAQREGSGPLEMSMVIPDDGEFVGRNWIDGFDAEIREYVLTGTLVRGRIIVPAATRGSPAEPLLDLALESGFEIRVLSTDSRFTLYGRSNVVLSETARTEAGRGIEVHRVSRSRAILDPIEGYFEMLWQLAVPWKDFGGETSHILHLLAQGWTDVRIAEELGVSVRTVSRRVSQAMETHGCRSRFELGARYGRWARAGGPAAFGVNTPQSRG